jgi:hypothetical protein
MYGILLVLVITPNLSVWVRINNIQNAAVLNGRVKIFIINYCKLKINTLKICFLTFCTQIPGCKCLGILSLIGEVYVINITNFMSQNYNMFNLIVIVLAAEHHLLLCHMQVMRICLGIF